VKNWRYLTSEGVGAADGLAYDEAMMLHYGRGEPEPAHAASLRLYTYQPHCALVGRFQALESEVDLEYCADHGIEVGRRPTGGGAIIMGPGQLGVAIASRAPTEESPRAALRRYSLGVVAGLAALGIEAHFRSKNDLEVAGRKIAGLGLYLDPRGAILFHASVLVSLDVELMLKVLKIPGAKVSDKAVARVEERVTTVSGELGRTADAVEIRSAFSRAMAEAFEVSLANDRLDDHEHSRMLELVPKRYGAQDWIHQRSPRRDARGTSVLKTPAGLLRFFVSVHGDTIKSVLVTGDFNTLPPEIARLEAGLRWCRAEPEKIAKATADALGSLESGDMVPAAVASGEGEGFGLIAGEVAEAVWKAASRGIGIQHAGLQQSAHPKRELGSCYFPECLPGPASNTASRAARHREES